MYVLGMTLLGPFPNKTKTGKIARKSLVAVNLAVCLCFYIEQHIQILFYFDI